MVNYCRVIGCHNRSDRETHLQFYRLPKVKKNQGEACEKLCDERRRVWLARLQQKFDGKNLDNIRVCSAHFISGKRAELYQKDSPDWAPSVNMSDTTVEEPELETGEQSQTDLTSHFIDSMTSELQTLRSENIKLKSEVEISAHKYSQSSFEVIDVMYIRMKPLVFWPEREELRKTMPMQFRKYFGTKCVVIIDCFEVFIDRPSNLKARAETWSSYKHHNTVKFLIGITPQGTVSYISKAWGGRASDKKITENSGFLSKLLPGDLVLADRGFDIEASVRSLMAEVKIPAFTKGKNQLAPIDLETTRKIANVRIHVERVIGTVRQKYTILNGPLPVDFLMCRENENLTLIDTVGHVYCACVNLCDSVVDFN
ncbi:unnamed protein product [Mytilus coruscus]|uniref:THAP-type domain-containing protein n=1 Tax=Mytilus coruscus TaxID=42192 RepID=A0A6J8EXQ2_MYTCO|nr:unnamed protein product [Mytilus coruscus]